MAANKPQVRDHHRLTPERPHPLSARRLRSTAYWTLVAVAVFNGLSAIGGGIGMVVADGLSMPKTLLADTPFTSFLVPGLILAVIIGGTQLVATVLLLTRREPALLWSAVAGFGMLIWIVSEIGLIHAFTWIQTIYVVSGLLELVLVVALLGVVSWLPRELHPRSGASRPSPVGTATPPPTTVDSR